MTSTKISLEMPWGTVLTAGVILFAALFIVILFSLSGSAREIVVDNNGGGNYTEILSALMASEEGDTIIVRGGNYSVGEQGAFAYYLKDNITLRGEGREHPRLIMNTGSSIYISASNLTITGINFTAANGEASGGTPPGIAVFNCENVTFFNNTLHNLSYGFSIDPGVRNITIMNNRLFSTPIYLSTNDLADVRTMRMENNTVDGKPLHYLSDRGNLNLNRVDGGYILVNCTNITVENAVNGTPDSGIQIFFSSDITLKDFSIELNTSSVTAYRSVNVSFQNCSVSGYIYLYGISKVEVRNCTLSGGLSVNRGNNILVENNNFSGERGIHTIYTHSITVTNNSFHAEGIRILSIEFYNYLDDDMANFSSYRISDNTVAGKPIYFYCNTTDIHVPSDAGQVILINPENVSAAGLHFGGKEPGITLSDPVNCTIRNSSFYGSATLLISGGEGNTIDACLKDGTESSYLSMGFNIFDSRKTVIKNSTFLNSSLRIDGEDNRVDSCTFSYSKQGDDYYGILVSGESIIYRTTVQGYYQGIAQSSGNLTLVSSKLTGNRVGLALNLPYRYGSEKSTPITISAMDCTFSQNSDAGITIPLDRVVLYLIGSTVSNNSQSGLKLKGDRISVSGGSFRGNGQGISIQGGDDVEIRSASFENNPTAIFSDHASNLMVRNCSIAGGRIGLFLEYHTTFILEGLSVRNVSGSGIRISNQSSGILRDTLISGCSNGVHIFYAHGEIQGCNFTENNAGIFAERPDSEVQVRGCIFHGNIRAAIRARENNAERVDARYNCWGAPSGPYDAAGNPDGKGDPVEGNVVFDPWYTDSSMQQTRSLHREEEPDTAAVYSFLGLIALLFIALIVAVIYPDREHGKKRE